MKTTTAACFQAPLSLVAAGPGRKDCGRSTAAPLPVSLCLDQCLIWQGLITFQKLVAFSTQFVALPIGAAWDIAASRPPPSAAWHRPAPGRTAPRFPVPGEGGCGWNGKWCLLLI
uniref:Uncharacterized protein n=1 Tax=Corethron hystrix TaxID=216773 RepID=A0A7S1FUB3_9STRA